jgi:hypothetical protein
VVGGLAQGAPADRGARGQCAHAPPSQSTIIGTVLELEKGFGGLIHVSPQPMRQAVAELDSQSRLSLYSR